MTTGPEGRRAARFGFNWWGGKYHLPGDEGVGGRLAEAAGFAVDAHDWVLEGGAIDVDGTGLAVTAVFTLGQALLLARGGLVDGGADGLQTKLHRRVVVVHIQEGVGLEHLLDFLVQLQRGQLQQPDRLLQLGRERQVLGKAYLK